MLQLLLRSGAGSAGSTLRIVWIARRCGALLVLLLIAGCASGPEPESPRSAGLGPEVLGDPRTLDPCSLVGPEALAGTGRARSTPTVSLDYCLLHVRTPDGSLAQLAVGELAEPDVPEGVPVQSRGPLRIAHDPPLPGHCTRQVLLDGGPAVRASADLLEGDPGSGLCAIAGAGADAAADGLAGGAVRHREVPPNSLVLADPCRVLDTRLVQQVRGVQGQRPRAAPGGHGCQWGEQDSEAARVQLVHTAGSPPAVRHGAAVAERVAGRPTVLSVVGGDPRVPVCSAETGHIPFGESGDVEVAMLVVAVPDETGVDACEYARGLAGHAWPNLPASSS